MGIVILGAGISGISAAYHLGLKGKKAVIFEKRDRWGGLCDNFKVDGFRFDHAVHLSFTKNEYVKDLFSKSADIITHRPPKIGNYYRGTWVKHPAQNNLYSLPLDVKIKSIKDFVEAKQCSKFRDYEQWLRTQYGDYFAEHFPMPYTRKYWTTDAGKLTTDWIGERMYRPNLDEVLEGAMSDKTSNTYYADEMRYPQKGGYKSFLNKMADECDIRLRKEAVFIDVKKKFVEFADGEKVYFKQLISSLPLPEMASIIKDIPRQITEAAQKLSCSSVALVSLGFNKPDVPDYLWFYIYDEDILPARVYSPNLKSPDNVPEGCSSLQFEIYSSKYKPIDMSGDDLIEHVIEKGKKMGIFNEKIIQITDYRKVKYANVIFDHNIKKNRKIVHDYLDSVGIKYIGRFGEWRYLWSDQSLLSGKKVTEIL